MDDTSQQIDSYKKVLHRLRERLPFAAEEIYLQKGLQVRNGELPDWWRDGDNTLILPVGSQLPHLSYIGHRPPRQSIVIIGSHCVVPHQIVLSGECPYVFLGPHCSLPNGTIICSGASTVILAGNLFAIDSANLDSRNGGLIYVGDDNLWSSNVKINTDDMHAIFDHVSLKRINRYGSLVAIGTHIWLGTDVLVNPGAVIEDNTVIGSRSVVTKMIPSSSVAVGAPARVIRRYVTWTREDVEPGSSAALSISPIELRNRELLIMLARSVFARSRRK